MDAYYFAKIAFEAYAKVRNLTIITSYDVDNPNFRATEWEDLSDREKDAWKASADVITKAVNKYWYKINNKKGDK